MVLRESALFKCFDFSIIQYLIKIFRITQKLTMQVQLVLTLAVCLTSVLAGGDAPAKVKRAEFKKEMVLVACTYNSAILVKIS